MPNKSPYNTSQISTNIKAIIIKVYRNIQEDFQNMIIRGRKFCNNGGFLQRKMIIVTDETFIERKGTEIK